MLAVLIRPGITSEDRAKYLNRLDLYTRVDPAEYVRIFGIVAGIAGAIGRAPPVAREPTAVDTATPETGAAELAEGSPTPNPSRGGRLGSPATRAQNAEIAAELEQNGFRISHGGGQRPEEYIPGSGPGTLGGTYVDITAVNPETGAVTRVQTIDTLADGRPTPREAAAADRIRAKFPNDVLILVPKRSIR